MHKDLLWGRYEVDDLEVVEAAIESLERMIERFGYVTPNDFFPIIGYPKAMNDFYENQRWTSITDFELRSDEEGWVLEVAKPKTVLRDVEGAKTIIIVELQAPDGRKSVQVFHDQLSKYAARELLDLARDLI